MDTKEISKTVTEKSIDELERVMLDNFDVVECPVKHYFTEGNYVRETTMPVGALITSRIHKTQHTFFVMKGKANVWIDGVKQLIEAPYIGITEPNTRRVLEILEECTWATSHPNPKNENLEQIEERIMEKYDNPLLSFEAKEKVNNLLKEKL